MSHKHELFSVITPTGDRPEAFELCWKYVTRQTVLPAEWIIVDDGKVPQEVPYNLPVGIVVKCVRRVRTPEDLPHTLPVQMIEALNQVTTDIVIIVEDDDWYRPDYFEQMMNLFADHPEADLIGQGQSVYYHVPFRKCFQLVNKDRASLCQTGFRSKLIPVVQDVCVQCARQREPFVDLNLWRTVDEKFLLLDHPPMCVGIKGLPGRTSGQTIGHKGTHRGFKPDPDGSKLRELIGNDARLYEKFQRTPPDVLPTGENRA